MSPFFNNNFGGNLRRKGDESTPDKVFGERFRLTQLVYVRHIKVSLEFLILWCAFFIIFYSLSIFLFIFELHQFFTSHIETVSMVLVVFKSLFILEWIRILQITTRINSKTTHGGRWIHFEVDSRRTHF